VSRKSKIFNLFKISQEINIKALENIADVIIKFFDPKELSFTEDKLRQEVYDYYTLESNNNISSFFEEKTKELAGMSREDRASDPLFVWWSSLKNAMRETAARRGWTENDNSPTWLQYEIIGRRSSPSSQSYKKYMTFKKMDDNGGLSAKFYQNYGKLPALLAEIAKENLSGELTFKIPSHPLVALRHKDSVVIHFKDMNDLPKIDAAVGRVGFDLVSRQEVGRTDIGVDNISGVTGKKSSDSQLAAEKAVENIKMNKDLLLRLINNPSTKMEGLSAINHILNKVMMESTHRGI
jgi:hypothetical protein